MRQLRSKLNSVATSLWDELNSNVGDYVRRSDKKRAHLAELKYLDEKSLDEIKENQIKIEQAQVNKTSFL